MVWPGASRGSLCKLIAQSGEGKGQVFKKLRKARGLTATPILPGIESQQAWEQYRDAILIASVGYFVSQERQRATQSCVYPFLYI
jgi:hypothetical protein